MASALPSLTEQIALLPLRGMLALALRQAYRQLPGLLAGLEASGHAEQFAAVERGIAKCERAVREDPWCYPLEALEEGDLNKLCEIAFQWPGKKQALAFVPDAPVSLALLIESWLQDRSRYAPGELAEFATELICVAGANEVAGLQRDLDGFFQISPERFPELGSRIDPSQRGPLGAI